MVVFKNESDMANIDINIKMEHKKLHVQVNFTCKNN